MEPSHPSFSYTWLVNRNPSHESPNCSFRVSFDAADGASFIEMDPNATPSKRFLNHQDFDFNVPKSPPSMPPAHAHNLISNGVLVPLKSIGPCLDLIPVSPLPLTTRDEGPFRKSRSVSLPKCNKFPKTIVKKYMDLVRPIWCIIRRGRSDSSRVQGIENWDCSSASGTRTSGACRSDNRRRSCDSESSIHEAVVHCKKTIAMH